MVMKILWIRSVVETARNPPRVVYKTMMAAPMIIAIWYSMPKRLLNSVPTALKPDAV